MEKISIGEKAPDFALMDENQSKVSLKDFYGKFVIIYFYPKDNTTGCTIEAMDFSKLKKEFEKENAVVFGVSKDSCESHIKFVNEKQLTVKLLSDPDLQMQKKYGVWQLKNFMGIESFGTIRTTFLIDKDGKIIKIWEKVIPLGHADAVLKELKKIKHAD